MASPPRTPDDPAKGSDEMLRAWIKEYGPALRRYFEKRVPPADAEDMVQDVFLSLSVRGGGEGIENVRGYLFQVARGVLAHRKYNYPTLGGSLEAYENPVEELSPERILLGKEALEKLLSAVENLPLRSREALLLHRFEEATYRGVARRMGITVSAVERLIARALRQVTTILEDRK